MLRKQTAIWQIGLAVFPSFAAAYTNPQWALQSVSGPSPRTLHGMVWDSCRNVVVLHGGLSDPTHRLGDTWEWNGSEWSLRATSGLGQRLGQGMAFDSDRCVTVVFGGVDGLGNYKNDTWEWDGTTWVQKCTSGCTPPGTRNTPSMSYDAAQHAIVLFGGYGPGLLNDTWEWNGSTWAQVTTTIPRPSPRSSPAMGYDPVRKRIVIFGGNLVPAICGAHSDETWELDLATNPATWTIVATPQRPDPRGENSHIVYEPNRNGMVLFGGTDFCTTTFDDTWEYDGETWVQISTSTAPEGRHGHDMVYDAVRQEIVLFGGDLGPLSDWDVRGDTWTFGEAGPIPVLIDIKPGSALNSINLGSRGVIPVAILTSDEFDAANVDPDTVQLAGSSVALRGNGSRLLAALTDVDHDGDWDLMLHVSTENLQLQVGATTAVLTGMTWDGEAIEGSDIVNIVPP